jgi:predicted nucleic acid-binding protein
MAAYFLDTNIFLRHLTRDDAEKAEACTRLFGEIAEGRIQAWTSDLAIAELIFVLSSKGPNGYNYTREEIRTNLGDLLTLPGLELPSKSLYPRIFELYTTHRIDFIDAYHAALVESGELRDIFSYDRDFDVLSTLIRLEP